MFDGKSELEVVRLRNFSGEKNCMNSSRESNRILLRKIKVNCFLHEKRISYPYEDVVPLLDIGKLESEVKIRFNESFKDYIIDKSENEVMRLTLDP